MLKFNSDITDLIYSLSNEQKLEFKKLIESFKLSGELNSVEIDFTFDDIIFKIENIIQYEDEKSKAKEAVAKGETTIPKERWGVHETHCCSDHGCKYGDIDCPVEMGLINQRYLCESCNDEF